MDGNHSGTENDGENTTRNSSPARNSIRSLFMRLTCFLPPELCIAGHGDVSGRAADIWSMGATLYCLKYGKLPFEKPGVLELYESIRTDEVVLRGESDENFIDLMHRILEKDPEKRIKMPELREHPWVTKDGTDPLLPEEENTAVIVPNPTDEEVSRAITKSMRHVLALVKAVQRFKKLIEDPEERGTESIFGQDAEAQIVQPPEMMDDDEELNFPSLENNRSAIESGAFSGGRKYPINPHQRSLPRAPFLKDEGSPKRSLDTDSDDICKPKDDEVENVEKIEAQHILREIMNEREKQAASISNWENSTYLFVGPSNYIDDLDKEGKADYFNSRKPLECSNTSEPPTFESPSAADDLNISTDASLPGAAADQEFCLSESPSAADDDIYEIAYRAEIERIRKQFRKPAPTVYLTRRVEDKPDSEALLKLAHDEGAVVSAPSNERRMTTARGADGVPAGTVQENSTLTHLAQRAIGSGAPIRGNKTAIVGERFRGVFQKIRKGM
ncbi:calcium/calmodulin dependent protein kinase [Ascosphaera apis ARSEF 7405]|uniref:Calcium/calmodulin dependent protein kinase n=1 Tax=Ascosphaera apis ARSEF 7405 TaxID=392613 RepID=A0A167XGU4_9EURO|nr:calcium/calmodulin dependent protein kinase [Ascosphaera apis ARSEF 7405]